MKKLFLLLNLSVSSAVYTASHVDNQSVQKQRNDAITHNLIPNFSVFRTLTN